KCNKKGAEEVGIYLKTQKQIMNETYGDYYISYEAKAKKGKTFSFNVWDTSYLFNGWSGDDPIISENLENDIKKLVKGLKKKSVEIKVNCKLIVDPSKNTYLTQNRMKKVNWR
ncbi:unnamed protein product, partial [marine sediment metagenome]